MLYERKKTVHLHQHHANGTYNQGLPVRPQAAEPGLKSSRRRLYWDGRDASGAPRTIQSDRDAIPPLAHWVDSEFADPRALDNDRLEFEVHGADEGVECHGVMRRVQ